MVKSFKKSNMSIFIFIINRSPICFDTKCTGRCLYLKLKPGMYFELAVPAKFVIYCTDINCICNISANLRSNALLVQTSCNFKKLDNGFLFFQICCKNAARFQESTVSAIRLWERERKERLLVSFSDQVPLKLYINKCDKY